ncbi:hypothetical protein AALP_AA8G341200 [Arabis alpina]|uniref:DUF7795 domain-containing protein n=1 Tax=Arabis alpina TaxID=50452 RepID=A0A087GB94_ARAAL|nr:hypothetical protein AALP_AA8G341200 [Arabis alpina]
MACVARNHLLCSVLSSSATLLFALPFDCDGVLVDTEKDSHKISFKDTFKEVFSSTLPSRVVPTEEIDTSSQLVENIIKNNETRRLKSYIEAGCINNPYAPQSTRACKLLINSFNRSCDCFLVSCKISHH